MKRVNEKFAQPLVAISATAALVTGCGEEASGTPRITPDAATETVLEQAPAGVDTAAWCGFVAARETIKWLAPDNQTGLHTGENQSQVTIQATPIGYTFTLEASLGKADYSVRGHMAVASPESSPLAALNTVALASEVRFDPSRPVAVWDLQHDDIGGTTNEPATICEASEGVVEFLQR